MKGRGNPAFLRAANYFAYPKIVGSATLFAEIDWMFGYMKLKGFIPALTLIPTLLVLGACTTQAWYEGVRQTREQECRKQPPGAVDDCLSRINKQGYDDYTKARSAK